MRRNRKMAKAKVVEHSAKYEYCKQQYEKGYMTKATLKKWVQVGFKRPGQGITPEEYEEITGEIYS